MITTNAFFSMLLVFKEPEEPEEPAEAPAAVLPVNVRNPPLTVVREVFMIHVGGTCCVPSSTVHIMNIQARITLIVECIQTCIFVFLCLNTRTSTIKTNLFSI